MKLLKLKLESVVISFLIIVLFSNSQVLAKTQEMQAYKGRLDISENLDRINWDWWKKFEDSILIQVLEQSIENNFDVIITDYKVKEADNYIASSWRKFLPFIKMGAGYRAAGSSRIDTYGRRRMVINSTTNLVYLPLEFEYELDFWGKRGDERAYFKQNRIFAEFEKNFVILSTVSEVSSIYFNILKNEELIALQKELVALKQEKLSINKEKYDSRLVGKPKILEIKKEMNTARDTLTALEAQNNEMKNRFYYLVSGDKEKTSVVFQNIDDINLFYDTEIKINTGRIANRPDVLIAEKQIKMTKLDVKLAKKALLPSFFFAGDIFHVSSMFNDFLHSESFMYRTGYSIIYDLFRKSHNLSELDAKKNVYKQALKTYEKAIVSSITDVNNSLLHLKSSIINYYRAKENSDLEKETLAVEREKLDMSLIAQEDYINSREKFIKAKMVEYESKTQCLIHSISLYKALGGNA